MVVNCENIEKIPDKFSNLMNAYQAHIDLSRDNNPTFNLWSGYIDKVQLMFLHIRATRTSDWKLHLQSFGLMMAWFFDSNSVHYSHFLPCYWLEMISLVVSSLI